MITAAGQVTRLVNELAERGELSEQWRAAFTEVPRHQFMPDTVWRLDRDRDGDDLVPVHRADDPDTWLSMVYQNSSVITQVDDGRPAMGGSGWEVTSSASMPSVVAQMLVALDVQPGMRVLEIGTGTGYNAALLAHRLGATNVTSVEIDPEVASHARRALAAAGYEEVAVVTGDGTFGYPPHAPYSRIICTAAAQRVPYQWVEQTDSGGKVLVPWASTYYPSGLLCLTVSRDGSATGRIGEPTAFMWQAIRQRLVLHHHQHGPAHHAQLRQLKLAQNSHSSLTTYEAVSFRAPLPPPPGRAPRIVAGDPAGKVQGVRVGCECRAGKGACGGRL